MHYAFFIMHCPDAGGLFFVDAEVVDLEPSGVVGGGLSVVATVAGMDAYGEVFAVGQFDGDAERPQDERIGVAACEACIADFLVRGEQVGIVGLGAVVLHHVVGEESTRAFLVHLDPQLALHGVAACAELLGGDGLTEDEVFGHGRGVHPADIVGVEIEGIFVDAKGVAAFRGGWADR